VERHETDDIALGRIRLLLIPGNDPFGARRGGGTAKQTSIDKIVQILHGHGRVGPQVAGRKDDNSLGHDGDENATMMRYTNLTLPPNSPLPRPLFAPLASISIFGHHRKNRGG
jgi:hypothetical protein